MEMLDCRRLTGPNLLLDRPGAVIEAALSPEEAGSAVAAWAEQARRLLDALGWSEEATAARLYPGGASLAISAPIDALYAATDVNEEAWKRAEAVLAGRPVPDPAETARRLRPEIAKEANPALVALRDAARDHGVSFLWDNHRATVGLGSGSRTWPVEALPDPDDLDWTGIRDIPVLLVTGTNGKTTTVRLLAAIVDASEQMAGMTSTDRIEVGGDEIEEGDYSGPGGARTLLRDRRVEVAILETARGGLLRRGLAVEKADAALVTNISADHLGEYGIHDLESLAEAKLVITRVVGPQGRVVLNADDPVLAAAAGRISAPIVWFSLDPDHPKVRERLAAGGEAVVLEDGAVVLARGDRREPVARVEELPITFGGAARHNVANILAAVGMASALGIAPADMARGLRRLRTGPEDNPGRMNLLERGGVRILLDYAHNPDGLKAMLEVAGSLPAGRRLMVIGQAGDRDEAAIRELARVAAEFPADLFIVKDLPEMLRGRLPGEVPEILEDELRRLGVPAERLERADSEIAAVRRALDWARPGDLLVLLVHTQRKEILELLRA
ncbi:MAG: Mur ligase family protein [Thermoanaerobaculia bacterium]